MKKNKTVAIMQPYFLPYLPYFQLIHAANIFIFLDDVNFINKGWINRNNFLTNKKKYLMTIPLIKKSQNRKILDHEIMDPSITLPSIFKTIDFGYKKAPFYDECMDILKDIFLPKKMISDLAIDSVIKISSVLKLDCNFIRSSQIPLDKKIKGEARIIKLSKHVNANHYINPLGGFHLYSKTHFKENNINLNFLESKSIKYAQHEVEFCPNLSVIDVLMFSGIDKTREIIKQYNIISQ